MPGGIGGDGLMLRLTYLIIAGLLAVISENAGACEITRLMSGTSSVATVLNASDDGIYKSYLVRNEVRDQEGVLNDWVKFELIPARWGFDLELPSGKRFAQINKDDGQWVVSASPGFMDDCADDFVTLRKNDTGMMQIYDNNKLIGSITHFPFEELF
jgi:hypothetical protein